MAYARPAGDLLDSALRSVARNTQRHGSLADLQVAVVDGYPYWVAADPDTEDGWAWFDALTGGRVAGPHQGGT